MNVAGILRNKGNGILSLKVGDSVEIAVKMLAEKKIGATVVLSDTGGLCGILSERDVVRGLNNSGALVLSKPVSELMTKNVQTCVPSDSISKIMAQMSEGRFRHLPVMEEDKLVGIISIGDVVKDRIRELESEANAMREYITTG